MGVATFEGIVEHGQIRLAEQIRLPEHTKVFVVVPEICIQGKARIVSPRLVDPTQLADFEMEIIEDLADARL
jgi:hypothetical protein